MVIQAKTIGEAWISSIWTLVKQAYSTDMMHMIWEDDDEYDDEG